ncbi:hypothetical protein RHMOL_Rhmol13G0138400 [Rhododendron molle]|uniref:Uncharacterized protein n=1 Tax=Rhododendron molle TaxID=49168 RepID=A0ACC0L6K7_RHOML|nr:hypothetical protein RHMOL_Rhmol13G0138400 [Rhododendron molle]
MTELLNYSFSKFTLNSIKISTKRVPQIRRLSLRPIQCVAIEDKRRVVVKNGKDSLDICRVVNGMWQTSGGWGRIERDSAVDAMLKYADSGLTTFDMADIYGPAEDLYGIFINRVRRERPPELLESVKGLTKWVPPPVKMTSSYVRESINVSRKRMDVEALDMLQFHWWDYSNTGYIDALKHLTDLKEEGKIKTVALTNFDTERLHMILENGIPVVSNQVQHSLVDMRPQQKMAELCQLTGVKLITYGTVMGGLLSEKFLDTNLSIPFAGPPLNTPSLQKYKRAAVAGSMVGVRLGLSEHIKDVNAVFSLVLDEEDVNSIREVQKKGKDLMRIIGDCGDEYRLDSQPMMEETILVGDDLMMGPPSPLIPPEIASHVLEGLQINDIEPFCQDEIVVYKQCAEKRDKELRQRLQDSEHKLGLSMPYKEAKERAAQLESEVTSLDRRLILASGIEGMEGFRQRWSLHGRLTDTKRRLEALKQGIEKRKKDEPVGGSTTKRWFFWL